MTGKDLWDLAVYALKYAGPLGLFCAVSGALLMYPTDCRAPVGGTAKCETAIGEVPVGDVGTADVFLSGIGAVAAFALGYVVATFVTYLLPSTRKWLDGRDRL